MRSNPWQIAAIIAIILVILLIIPIVIMGRDRQNLHERATQAETAQRTTANEAATLQGDVNNLLALIGGTDALPMGEQVLTSLETKYTETVQLYRDILNRALPGENITTQTYNSALDAILGDLEREREEHARTGDALAQVESDYSNAKQSYDDAIATVQSELEDARSANDGLRQQFAVTQRALDEELKKAQTANAATLASSERERRDLRDQLQVYTDANYELTEAKKTLADMLEGIRNPNIEHPAGKIVSVDQGGGLAVLNLGSADGLLPRTMFSVYHANITALSFHNAPVGEEPVYCDVCMRNISRNIAKASVEVVRILGPHRAEVRILDDILTDPIMVGDIVHSPIWKPGQRMRFALTAGMQLPGTGNDSGVEAIKRLIEMQGGVVDCWIDELAPLNELQTEEERYLKGEISNLTNYIVVNDVYVRDLDPAVDMIQQSLLKNAELRSIRTISLGELLNRMGWRNVTPVHSFSSPDFLPEMRVVPQAQGDVRASSNTVSPVFTPENVRSRVSARDAHPIRTSPGTITPFFQDNVPPPPHSSGKTSDLFRPRSPSGSN